MARWMVILFLLGGLGLGSYNSFRGKDPNARPVTALEDGSGFPTPRPR